MLGSDRPLPGRWLDPPPNPPQGAFGPLLLAGGAASQTEKSPPPPHVPVIFLGKSFRSC